ncbi:gag-asp_proteas domain-containing protein [Gossypium australe]|uniref:Gag-asp_proteas domain-containing protein n=1 Tax=Gossypium australe TaxID=47621 RepID=A0A5B6VV09_9ROSI|nr:gag-asp_proteas domain-containing protein [Gossypium australe]
MVARRKKIKVGEQVNLSAFYSVFILRQVHQKLKDLRNFTILIEIESIHFNRVPYLKTTPIPLQLANRFSVHPKGVLEDVLVKVRSFIIRADFVVLDFEEDSEIKILLG